MIKVKALFKSRRFWVAVSTVVVVILQDALGLTEVMSNSIAAMGVSWILGDSVRPTE